MLTRSFATLVLLAALAAPVHAQDYPARVIKVMQGFAPGGNVDVIARLLAHHMEKSLRQPIIIEAKPGGAGSIAADLVSRSAPDGYSLLVTPSAHAMYGGLARNVRYKVVEDFTWISTASFYPFLICVRQDSRFRTLQQLIDEARKRPGDLKYGSSGFGTGLHTIIELLAHHTQTKYLHVPYRGEGHVPTVSETAVPGFEFISWTSLAGPANLPGPVVDRLNAELRKAIADPEVKRKLKSLGGDPRASTPAEMTALVARQYELWKRLAKETGIAIN